ncbi:MAG TPA: hypothetical protein VGL59_12580, partial [Polyangia bacterium]
MSHSGIAFAQTPTSSAEPSSAPRHARLFWIAALVWVVAVVATWPLTLSFGDEVGYIGQARVMLQGRIHPTLADPGVWHER